METAATCKSTRRTGEGTEGEGMPAASGRRHRGISSHEKTKANTFRGDWNKSVYRTVSESDCSIQECLGNEIMDLK